MSIEEKGAFGPVRSFLWPIYSHELKKVLSLACILCLICFNYTILRNMKDAVVISAKSSGASVIPFIKVWVLLPMAILVTLLYAHLSSRYRRETVFYLMISGALSYFLLFTFVLYPSRDFLELELIWTVRKSKREQKYHSFSEGSSIHFFLGGALAESFILVFKPLNLFFHHHDVLGHAGDIYI